jgi:hypothetical protein
MGFGFPSDVWDGQGYRVVSGRFALPVRFTFFLFVVALSGCQYQAVSAARLQIHQSRLNKEGLSELQVSPELNITCAIPNQWDKLRENQTLIYTHQQWRSPDRHAGVGVAYLRTPMAMSPETLIWFAKMQYANQARNKQGRLLGSWTDSLGRSWFEAENEDFHVRGYAMTRGCDAWIVYSGYRVKARPPEDEIALGQKAAESVAPLSTP